MPRRFGAIWNRNSSLQACLAESAAAAVSIVCLPRHGHATTRTTIEALFASTQAPFRLVVVDIASPESVRSYLEAEAHARPNLFHVRLDEFVSRQTARLMVLDRIQTPYRVLVDNTCYAARVGSRPCWTAPWRPERPWCPGDRDSGGPHIHFSGGFVVPYEGVIVRPHAWPSQFSGQKRPAPAARH